MLSTSPTVLLRAFLSFNKSPQISTPPDYTHLPWSFLAKEEQKKRREKKTEKEEEKMYEFTRVSKEDLDLEEGTLYPGISHGDNALRWGFIRKVYGILAAQILLTTIVSAVTVLYTPISDTLRSSPGLVLGVSIVPLFLMFPLYHYQQKHPLNFVFLGLFTVFLSLSVGIACANTKGRIVLEALILTSGVVFALTGYTFWASKKGKDFSYLGPILFAGLMVLFLTGLIQMFFPLGSASVAIYGGLGAILFSAYLVYDTDNLIKRFTYDEYIWASVVLYLDILNLFISLLQLLRSSDG